MKSHALDNPHTSLDTKPHREWIRKEIKSDGKSTGLWERNISPIDLDPDALVVFRTSTQHLTALIFSLINDFLEGDKRSSSDIEEKYLISELP